MRKTALAAALLAVAAVATPSHASYVRACVATGTVMFDPPLNAAYQDGTMTWTYNNNCALVDSGGGSGLTSSSGSIVYDYHGSCITADVVGTNGGGSTGTLIGGTVMVRTASSPTSVRVWLLLLPTTSPCNMYTAAAVTAGPDVSL